MKRSVVWIAVLLLSAASLRAQGVTVSMPDTSITGRGTITVPVTLSGVSPGTIYAYQLRIEWNPYHLAVDSVIIDGTSTARAGFQLAFNRLSDAEVLIAAGGGASLDEEGVMLYLRFRVLHAGGTAVNFDPVSDNFFNEGDPAAAFINGNVWITDPPALSMQYEREPIYVGETIQTWAWGGTQPYMYDVANHAVATIDQSGNITGLAHGQTYVIITDNAGLTDTSDSPVRVWPFGMIVRDTTMYASPLMSVPVETSPLTGLNVLAGKATFRFVEHYVHVTDVRAAGGLAAVGADPVWNVKPNGVLEVSFASSTPVQGGGPLLIIDFASVEGHYGGWTLEVTDVLFNEDLPGAGRNGYVQVSDPQVATLSPATLETTVGEQTDFSFSSGTAPFEWWVSDTSVASVDATGRLTALKRGVTRVYARDVTGAVGASDDVTVYDTRISIPDLTARIGGVFDVPFMMDPVPLDPQASSLQCVVQYDTTVLRYVGLENELTLTHGWTFVHSAAASELRIAGAGASGMYGQGMPVLLRLQFEVRPEAGQTWTALTISSLMLNEGLPTALTVSNGVTTVLNFPPTAPVLAEPADGDTVQMGESAPADILFHWYASNDPDGDALLYTFSFNGPGIDTTIADINDTTVTLSVVPQLWAESAYAWTISVTDGQEVVLASQWFTLYTSAIPNRPPTAPVLIAPADGDSLDFRTAGAFQFTWHPSFDPDGDPLSYGLQILGLGVDTVFASTADTTLYLDLVLYLPLDQSFSWTVSAFDGEVTVASAPSVFFAYATAGNLPPTPPVLAYPADGDSVILGVTTSTVIHFGWYPSTDPDGDALTYTLIFRGPGADIAEAGLTDTSHTLTFVSPLLPAAEYHWYVLVTDGQETVQSVDSFFVRTVVVLDVEVGEEVTDYALEQNYPNPFNPSTKIGWRMKERGWVKVSVMNLLGQEVAVLVSGERDAGIHSAIWNAEKFPAGIYLCKMEAGNLVQVKRMVLLK